MTTDPGADLLKRVLDELELGIAVLDAAGALVHANRAMRCLLRADADREAFQLAARSLLSTGAAVDRTRRGHLPAIGAVRLAGSSWRLTVQPLVGSSPAEEPAGAPGGYTLITLDPAERVAAALIQPESLRARFGLSPRECRVARLLAQGRSNGAIAAELGISPHTALHHTRSIFARLGVHSRAEALAMLWGASADEE